MDDQPLRNSNADPTSGPTSRHPDVGTRANGLFALLLLMWLVSTAWLLIEGLEFLWEALTKSVP
jgi:hypothetical protein